MQPATIIGLARDVLVAGLGLAILFGASISDDQVAGIVLFVGTLIALGSYIYTKIDSPKGKL